MRRPFPLRVPKTPHAADDRLVPVHGCGCAACVAVRDQQIAEAEAQHWGRVGVLLGLDAENRGKTDDSE